MQAALAAALVGLLGVQVSAVLAASLDETVTQPAPRDPKRSVAWEEFKKKYQRTYSSPEEEAKRYKIFVEKSEYVEKHNAEEALDGRYGFGAAINQFSDLTNAEISKMYTCFKKRPRTGENPTFLAPYGVTLNKTVDWRKHGYVTSVKDQTPGCGACYAFSAVGSLEGQHFKKTGKLASLSAQNLVDCSDAEYNLGCAGGDPGQSFEYITKNKGIDTETGYPYTAKDGTCRYDATKIGATCTGHTEIAVGDEEALRVAVATVGPISVSIDASRPSFWPYDGKGIYNEPECSTSNLTHSVVVVGYGDEGGKAYWLVKNSWGKTWGMAGYIKMSRNKSNQCGIATEAVYPLV